MTATLMPPGVRDLRLTSLAESDVSSDTDQEIFHPYYSTADRVYDTAEIGLAPEDRYRRLMGCCTTQENVSDILTCTIN